MGTLPQPSVTTASVAATMTPIVLDVVLRNTVLIHRTIIIWFFIIILVAVIILIVIFHLWFRLMSLRLNFRTHWRSNLR